MPEFTDVFIIGGGPAGLAAAIAARQKGFHVTVADGAAPPIDKACGEGLLPEGIAALQRLGVDVPPGDSSSFRGIRFLDGDSSVDASFPSGAGLGVRRTKLHELLIARAAASGVSLLWQTPVTGLFPDGVSVAGTAVRARWIVGADGGSSLVRRWAGLDSAAHFSRRFSYRRHYRIRPWTDCVEIHWGRQAQVYVTPVAANEIGVALISRDPGLRLDQALPRFPNLNARLAAGEPSSTERGAVTATLRLNNVYRGRVALIGDASGGVDAITGDGLSLAFQQAEFLAHALASSNLAQYQTAHRRLARRPLLMSRLMLMLDRHPTFRQRATQAFARNPALFARFLAFHVGAASPAALATSGLRLGWDLLTA